MVLTPLSIPGLSLITPTVHGDARGFFVELFNKQSLADAGLPFDVLQHNRSRSGKNTVRGLHFQWEAPLGKIVQVPRGRAFLVAVDIRPNSPTLGKWESRILSEETHEALHLPAGFASGFCALEEVTEVEYYYDAFYNKDGESVILWNDARLAISWPTEAPILSARDSAADSFDAWLARPEAARFSYAQ